jgi:hypothetical protein
MSATYGGTCIQGQCGILQGRVNCTSSPGGSFALRRGLTPLVLAYYDAVATREDFDVDRVVQGILKAIGASTPVDVASSTTPAA